MEKWKAYVSSYARGGEALGNEKPMYQSCAGDGEAEGNDTEYGL